MKEKKNEKKNETAQEVEETTTEQEVSEFDKIKAELDDTKQQLLRMAADYDNFRKRSQREKESAYNDSKASTLALLLPVIDNFDRAIDNKTDDIEAYRKGIEMTYNQLKDILSKADVVPFGEVGEEFNPEIHNAVMTMENPDLPENTISAVFEKGYKMGDRVLRFASVQITQ